MPGRSWPLHYGKAIATSIPDGNGERTTSRSVDGDDLVGADAALDFGALAICGTFCFGKLRRKFAS
jgi:hypothetical protein